MANDCITRFGVYGTAAYVNVRVIVHHHTAVILCECSRIRCDGQSGVRTVNIENMCIGTGHIDGADNATVGPRDGKLTTFRHVEKRPIASSLRRRLGRNRVTVQVEGYVLVRAYFVRCGKSTLIGYILAELDRGVVFFQREIEGIVKRREERSLPTYDRGDGFDARDLLRL